MVIEFIDSNLNATKANKKSLIGESIKINIFINQFFVNYDSDSVVKKPLRVYNYT